MIKNAKNKATKKPPTKGLTTKIEDVKTEPVKVKAVAPPPVRAAQRPQYVRCWSCSRSVAVKQYCDFCGKPLGGEA